MAFRIRVLVAVGLAGSSVTSYAAAPYAILRGEPS